MKSVTEFLTEEQLNEKLLLINNGKRYGQIVILAGGAGSGKGFASNNFMNIQDFKVRDVDEMKRMFLKINKATGKYPEIKGLNLRNPKDVAKLHAFVEKLGTTDKTLSAMLSQSKNPETLPNILFDVTLKNISKANKLIPELIGQGYKEENIHLVWVLTDYKLAVAQNRGRERVVPDDILLQTHEGAANTMWDILDKGKIPKGVNGGIYVILNNRKNTIFFKGSDGKDYRNAKDNKKDTKRLPTGKGISGKKEKDDIAPIIKDFKYLVFKKPKKSPLTNAKIKLQLWAWITNNIPVTQLTAHIWDAN